MPNIVKVKFIYENCESLVLNSTDIPLMDTSAVQKKYRAGSGRFDEHEYLEHVFISVQAGSFPDEESSLHGTPSSRIRSDVTIITFVYDDDSTKSYRLPWPDEEGNEYYSSNQRTGITPAGHQYFISSSDTRLDHLIDKVDFYAQYM